MNHGSLVVNSDRLQNYKTKWKIKYLRIKKNKVTKELTIFYKFIKVLEPRFANINNIELSLKGHSHKKVISTRPDKNILSVTLTYLFKKIQQ